MTNFEWLKSLPIREFIFVIMQIGKYSEVRILKWLEEPHSDNVKSWKI